MADLTAGSGAPTLLFDDTTGGTGVNWRIKLAPDDELHVQRWSSGASAFVDRLAFTASDTTSYGTLMISGTEPALIFVDTSTGEDDFRIRVTGDLLYLESDTGTGFDPRLTISSADAVFSLPVTITGTEPALTFTDSTGGDDDFRIRVNGDILFIESSSGGAFGGLMTLSSTQAVVNVPVTIYAAEPILTLSDSDGGEAEFRFRVNSDVIHIEGDDGGGFVSGLELDPAGCVYAPIGLISGHDAAYGPSHAICWKRRSGALAAGDITNGYFTHTLTDLSPPEWYAKTMGVIVMMSDSHPGSVFQVADWRSSSASGFFSVQVIYGDSSTGDAVKVTFDTSQYAAGDDWLILAFYAP